MIKPTQGCIHRSKVVNGPPSGQQNPFGVPQSPSKVPAPDPDAMKKFHGGTQPPRPPIVPPGADGRGGVK